MPAVGRGLGLVDRVVRRHVAKLEKVGWCERTPAVRGDGMLVWMTPTGLDRVGLGQLPAPRAPNPFSPQTRYSTRVAWVPADIEHAGHQWIASRELALAPGPWGAEIANERGGYSRRLPDLVFWSAWGSQAASGSGGRPGAVQSAARTSGPRGLAALHRGRSIRTGLVRGQSRVCKPPATFGHGHRPGPRRSSSSVNTSWPTSFRYLPRSVRTSTRSPQRRDARAGI